ncbi:MAG: GNAT family protein, partial [Candidatus Omnitrophota bacterium]
YWNQGIMTKVLMKVTDKGLKEYGFKRIEMCVFASNDASCRVAEKCDYKFERIVPCAHQKAGRSIDAKLYAAMSTPT